MDHHTAQTFNLTYPILMLEVWRLYHWVWKGMGSPLSVTPHHPQPPPIPLPLALTHPTLLPPITMPPFTLHGRPHGAS